MSVPAGRGGLIRGRRVDEVFAALGDPTRRSLFEHLVSEGPVTASTLSVGHEVSRQAIVKHLKVLNSAGLVDAERVGREVRYGATKDSLAPLEQWMARSQGQWERRLAKLGRNARARDT